MTNLIITESPTTARSISICLDDKKYKVISCYGRILELDPISPEEYISNKEIKWSSINPSNLAYIKSVSEKAEKIIIATDPDIEGEVIAWQLFNLFNYLNIDGGKINRSTFNSITRDEILKSIESNSKINEKKAQSGISRRIFDNFSRFTFSDDQIKKQPFIGGSSSRIVAPMLKSINDKPLETYTIKYQRNGMTLPAHLTLNSSHDLDRTLRKLERLPPPVFSKVEEKEGRREAEALDFKGLLKKSLEITSMSQSDIYENLQSLYKKGKISYFRSDSQNLNLEQKKHLKKELKKEGALSVSLPEPDISEINSKIQDGHTAITPIDPIGNSFSKFQSLNDEDKLLSIIWRHWALNSQEREFITKNGILEENAFENIEWIKMAKEYALEFKESTISNQHGKHMPFDERLKPLGVSRSLYKKEKSALIVKHSKDEAIINRLTSLGIGRPSTIVYHSSKIASKYINDDSILNSRGISAIIENKKANNRMLEIDVALKIEEDLHSPHTIKESEGILINSLNRSGNAVIKSTSDISPKESKKTHKHLFNWSLS